MKKIFLLIAIILMSASFKSGMSFEAQTTEPIVETQYIDRPVYIEVVSPPDTIIQTVEVIKEVETIKYKSLQPFKSLEDLQAFLLEDNTDSLIILVADSSGKVALSGFCEDRAFQLQDQAAVLGNKLETEILTRSEYTKHYGNTGGLGINDGHMICKAIIGNTVYFIDPATDEVWTNWSLD